MFLWAALYFTSSLKVQIRLMIKNVTKLIYFKYRNRKYLFIYFTYPPPYNQNCCTHCALSQCLSSRSMTSAERSIDGLESFMLVCSDIVLLWTQKLLFLTDTTVPHLSIQHQHFSKVTDSGKLSAILPKLDSPDKVRLNYFTFESRSWYNIYQGIIIAALSQKARIGRAGC